MNEILKYIFIFVAVIVVICLLVLVVGAVATGDLISIFTGGGKKKSNNLYKIIKLILLTGTSFLVVNYIKN